MTSISSHILRRYGTAAAASRRFNLPAATRSYTGSAARQQYEQELNNDKSKDDIWFVNAAQTSGPRWPFESKVSEEALKVRVDMPDVAADAIKVWTENNTLFFLGHGVQPPKGSDESGRVYGGSVDLLPSASYYRLEEMAKEMKDGILKLVVPLKTDDELKEMGTNRVRLT